MTSPSASIFHRLSSDVDATEMYTGGAVAAVADGG